VNKYKNVEGALVSDQKIKKVVIFAGGEGTRLSELTGEIPKPLVPIGPDPVMVHIMRHFYRAGYREFIIAVGYMSDEFKRYFRDYGFRKRDVTFTKNSSFIKDSNEVEDWTVHIVETGLKTNTGERLHAVRDYIGDEPFFLTYGDSVSNVDLREVERMHFSRPEGNLATITAINREERFGILKVNDENGVESFNEKSSNSAELINGGFIACNPGLLNEVNSNSGDFSHETLTKLADLGNLSYYRHHGFWHAMDTKRDYDKLNKLYTEQPELF
jgi:glucose-1-phosphate cytidylyltransferase